MVDLTQQQPDLLVLALELGDVRKGANRAPHLARRIEQRQSAPKEVLALAIGEAKLDPDPSTFSPVAAASCIGSSSAREARAPVGGKISKCLGLSSSGADLDAFAPAGNASSSRPFGFADMRVQALSSAIRTAAGMAEPRGFQFVTSLPLSSSLSRSAASASFWPLMSMANSTMVPSPDRGRRTAHPGPPAILVKIFFLVGADAPRGDLLQLRFADSNPFGRSHCRRVQLAAGDLFPRVAGHPQEYVIGVGQRSVPAEEKNAHGVGFEHALETLFACPKRAAAASLRSRAMAMLAWMRVISSRALKGFTM